MYRKPVSSYILDKGLQLNALKHVREGGDGGHCGSWSVRILSDCRDSWWLEGLDIHAAVERVIKYAKMPFYFVTTAVCSTASGRFTGNREADPFSTSMVDFREKVNNILDMGGTVVSSVNIKNKHFAFNIFRGDEKVHTHTHPNTHTDTHTHTHAHTHTHTHKHSVWSKGGTGSTHLEIEPIIWTVLAVFSSPTHPLACYLGLFCNL
jgi:hypothetical protein